MKLPDRGYAWVFLGASSYGLVSSLVKLAYEDGLASEAIATAQSLVGLVLMLAAIVVARAAGHVFEPPSRRELLGTLALGTSTAATAYFYFGALERLTASLAIVLLFQFTWMGVLVEAVIRRERPSASSLAALVAAWAGTLLAAGVFDEGPLRIDARGALLGLGSGVSYTAFVVGSSRIGTTIAPLPRGALMALGASVVMCCAFPPRFLGDAAQLSTLAPWALGLGICGVIVPNVTFSLGAPRIGGERASIVAAVELPVAVLVAYFALGERISALAVVGVLLILLAVTLPELDRLRSGAG